LPEERIGKVANFFSKINVAAIELDNGDLKIGDKLKFKGSTTNFEQIIDSMQIDRISVDKAEKGSAVGIKVADRTRAGDLVYKIIE
jgi:putative protease